MEEKTPKLRDSEEKTQESRPKKGEPVEIPVPKRKDFAHDLLKVAKAEQRDEKA